MLGILRHKGVSRKILWAVAVVIILSFGVFGTAYRLDNVINSAGKIYGRSVSLRDFERAYLDSRDQAIILYGDRFFKMGQNLDLEREAWDRLILLKEAKERRIQASDKEVVEFIAAIPFFQQGGKFDHTVYESIVRNPGVFDRKPKDFEQGARRSIIIRKLFDQAAGPMIITDEELKKEFIKRNEKIKLTYALFAPADFNKELAATDEEARKFYDEHKENFRQPPMVNVQYAHLLYPEKADDAQKQNVKKDALGISKDLTPKADFAAVAQKYHSQAKESGFFTQEQPLLTFAWSPEFVDKIFAMKANEISNPMESPDGWQVIKIKEKKESAVPEYGAIVD
ncbi:MAG: peptidylprolyl isomerase, partial [Candidatus Omnitrophica bacterium]|nr:peptidylprolyl isomerase [Candidatus Omnitrophota bacterium]